MNHLLCKSNTFFHPQIWKRRQIFYFFGLPLILSVGLFFFLYQSSEDFLQEIRKKQIQERKREILLYKTTGIEPFVWKPAMQCVYLHKEKFPYERISECIPVNFYFVEKISDRSKDQWKFSRNHVVIREKLMPHCTFCHQKKTAVEWVFLDKEKNIFLHVKGWIFIIFWGIWSIGFVAFILVRNRTKIRQRKDIIFSDSMIVFSTDAQNKKHILFPSRKILFWMEKDNVLTGIINNRETLIKLIHTLKGSEKMNTSKGKNHSLFNESKLVFFKTSNPFENDVYESCYASSRLLKKLDEGIWIMDVEIYQEFYKELIDIIPINEADIQKNRWMYRNTECAIKMINWKLNNKKALL